MRTKRTLLPILQGLTKQIFAHEDVQMTREDYFNGRNDVTKPFIWRWRNVSWVKQAKRSNDLMVLFTSS